MIGLSQKQEKIIEMTEKLDLLSDSDLEDLRILLIDYFPHKPNITRTGLAARAYSNQDLYTTLNRVLTRRWATIV